MARLHYLLFGIAAVLGCSISTNAQIPKQLKKLLKKNPEPSALDQYVEAAHRRAASMGVESPGSLYSGLAVLSDMAIDLRARNIDDVVTIVVSEQASAVSTGQTKTLEVRALTQLLQALLVLFRLLAGLPIWPTPI